MPAEFGPIVEDKNPTLPERVAAVPYGWAASVLSMGSDGKRLRFDRKRFVLSIHGESDYSGDAFNRGQLVSNLETLVYMGLAASGLVLPFVSEIIGYASGDPSAIVVAGFGVVSIIWMCVCTMLVLGLPSLPNKVRVFDHTAEPLPQELESLQQQFVDGDLDEHELADRVEAVIDR